jgi:hypothetical protein
MATTVHKQTRRHQDEHEQEPNEHERRDEACQLSITRTEFPLEHFRLFFARSKSLAAESLLSRKNEKVRSTLSASSPRERTQLR